MTAPKPKRRWIQFSWRTLFVGGLLSVVIYLASFFLMRQIMSVTFFSRHAPRGSGGFYSVRVYWFSKNPRINYAAWVIYYPLHRQRLDSLKRFEDALFVDNADDDFVRDRGRSFYVPDVNVLYRAEVVGFREK